MPSTLHRTYWDPYEGQEKEKIRESAEKVSERLAYEEDYLCSSLNISIPRIAAMLKQELKLNKIYLSEARLHDMANQIWETL